MQAALASGTLTQAQTQALGMFSDFTGPMGTPGGLNGGTEIHDYLVNPLSYLSENTNPYASTSPGQAANAASTAQDWGNFEGLQALLAADINSSQANALSNLNASGLTGTQAQAQAAQQLIQPAYNFDNGNFTTAVNQQNADYNTGVLKQVQNFINSIDSGTPADQAAQTESEWMNAQGINNVLNMLPN